ncbi:MAG: alkaline phosphatase PhoX [Pseudohongiellaceae bacterium]
MTFKTDFRGMDRRRFLEMTGSAFLGLLASGCTVQSGIGTTAPADFSGYGPLKSDPDGILDLPEGFQYRVLSRLGDTMSDGGTVPNKADGMGCFQLNQQEIVLIRNHELVPGDPAGGIISQGFDAQNGTVVPGGTTHIVLDAETLSVNKQFRSLGGTIRNCSGGVTPWNSWLTCEESVTGPGQRFGDGLSKNHGWVFDIPAAAAGLSEPQPLTALGRFNHEAACVDPESGFVYLTEDRNDSVLYRFLPNEIGNLQAGGRLQAMVIEGISDTRNWENSNMIVGQPFKVSWTNLTDVESPNDDLRHRAAASGASLIARGEGIHMGVDELFFCSTSGGTQKLGQIFKFIPGRNASEDRIELFFESESVDQFNYGDNLVVAPNGHLIVCEDQYTEVVDNHLRVISPEGNAFKLGRLRLQTEPAGACFSPDGKWMFVNAYAPTMTLAISGPWASASSA